MLEYEYTTDAAPINKRCKYTDDYIGLRFGSLVVISYPAKNGVRAAGAICRCDCGNLQLVPTIGKLLNGKTTQCAACGHKATGRAKSAWWSAHPEYRKSGDNPYRDERLYKVWMNMRSRCNDDYGYCKDVEVCDEWHNYPTFREWAYSHGYDESAPRGVCTIDRINPFGNYEPSNCRWVDMKTQSQNKRSHWLRMSEEERQQALAQAK